MPRLDIHVFNTCNVSRSRQTTTQSLLSLPAAEPEHLGKIVDLRAVGALHKAVIGEVNPGLRYRALNFSDMRPRFHGIQPWGITRYNAGKPRTSIHSMPLPILSTASLPHLEKASGLSVLATGPLPALSRQPGPGNV